MTYYTPKYGRAGPSGCVNLSKTDCLSSATCKYTNASKKRQYCYAAKRPRRSSTTKNVVSLRNFPIVQAHHQPIHDPKLPIVGAKLIPTARSMKKRKSPPSRRKSPPSDKAKAESLMKRIEKLGIQRQKDWCGKSAKIESSKIQN